MSLASLSIPAPETAASFLTPELSALRACEVLASQPLATLAALARNATVKHLAMGATLVREGQPYPGLVLVVKGRLKLMRHAENGRAMTFEAFRPGELWADGAFATAPAAASLVAGESSVVILLGREAFVAHVRAFPEALLALASEQARRLSRTQDLAQGLAFVEVPQRVEWALRRLARREGQPVDDGLWLRQRPTQQEVANSVGACRETVSRVFADLVRRRLLVPRGRGVLVAYALVEPASAA